MEIKAIETRYDGHRFRSRLEARWAVFFKTLGIEYQYEAEGFEMGGVRYLPDFFIPLWDCYVEVKGVNPSEIEEDKARRLAQASGRHVLLIVGNPWPNENDIRVFIGSIAKDWPFRYDVLIRCIHCKGHFLYCGTPTATYLFKLGPHEDCTSSLTVATMGDEIRSAYETARAARFEHGEMP